MLITCYVFSDRTLQVGHTYYSMEQSFVALYLELEYYKKILCLYSPFVYEVEVDTDNIFHCNKSFIISRAYKIKRKIEPKEIFNKISLSEWEIKELNDIFNGKITHNDLYKDYGLSIQKPIYELSTFTHRKILAYISSIKYELPRISIRKESQLQYIKLLDYYDRLYSIPILYTWGIARDMIEVEQLKSARDFECFIYENLSTLIHNPRLNELILSRQLKQTHFNRLCNYIKTQKLDTLLGFVNSSIKAGYEILPEYKTLFYPYVLYHNPKNLDSVIAKDKTRETIKILLHCGYKLKNYDYKNINNDYKDVVEAKTIFQNGFKYIE